MRSKLLKVTMEFEDKTQYLEGEIAEQWLKECNAKCVMEAVHGRPFSEYKWVVTPKGE
uniref:Uncharacterized protein n=1 Tax=viral metagenome TaxID=1070528 RepID=A0A6M3JL37_9ZZZZ